MDKKNIEKMIKELTEVRPEMLNAEALKLYDFIMNMIDEKQKLETKVKELEEQNMAKAKQIKILIDKQKIEYTEW